MSSREEFAGIGPSGRVVISGAITGLEVLERALAGWPVPESTKGGRPPPRMHPKLCKLYQPPPPVDAEHYRGQCSSLAESGTHCNSSNEWVHEEWFDSDEHLPRYMRHGIRRLIPFLCSAPGWPDSSWTSRPNTWTSRPSRDGLSWGPNTGEPNTSSYNNNNDAAPNDWVDQSWQSNAPRTQATTRTNQSDPYYYNDNDEDYGDLPDAWSDDEEDYAYAILSWSTPPPSYDTVPKPESLWQPYNMPQYNHEIETIDQLQHLGTFGMKPPYRFGTHEDDPLKSEYTKLEPSILTIASSAMAGQRANHVFLSERHAAVVTKTNATITELGKTINIDS